MTECNKFSFSFTSHFSRKVQADFAGGQISSDGGALLLRETERRVDVIGRFTACFRDQRHASYIRHEIGEMIGQRVYSLALGYEELDDYESCARTGVRGAGRQIAAGFAAELRGAGNAGRRRSMKQAPNRRTKWRPRSTCPSSAPAFDVNAPHPQTPPPTCVQQLQMGTAAAYTLSSSGRSRIKDKLLVA